MKKVVEILLTPKVKVLIDQAIYSGGGFLITILLAKNLNVADFGLYSSIILISYLLISFTSSLIVQPYQVAISTTDNLTTYTTFTLVFQVFCTVFLLLIIYIILQFQWFKTYSDLNFSAILFAMGVLMHDYFRKIFLAQGFVNNVLAIDFSSLISQIFVLLFIWFYGRFTLGNALLYLGFSYSIPIVLAFALSKIKFCSYLQFNKYLKLHFTEGAWLLLVATLQWCSSNFFVMVSGLYVGIEALGAFRLVQSMFGVLNMLLQTFENYVLPSLSRIHVKSIIEGKKYLKNVTIQGGILFIIVLAVLFIFSTEIIILAGGNQYSSYGYVVKLMTVLYVIIYLGYPFRMIIRVLMMNKSFFIGYLISFIFSVLSFHFLLQKWNLMGAIIGLCVNQLLMIFYWQYQLIQQKYYLWK